MAGTRTLRSLLAFGGLALILSCNGGSSHTGGTGTVQVHLTDAPIDLSTVQSVTVTITGVIVYRGSDAMMPQVDDGGSIALVTHPETFDLLTLTGGATTLLASGEVPAGSYQRIRLEISSATLTYKDGTEAPLKIDSNKVDIPISFHVAVDQTSNMTLDFDAAASVQVNDTASGTLILRPVVTPVGMGS
jgi:Domain of unknown function (DUF4382)